MKYSFRILKIDTDALGRKIVLAEEVVTLRRVQIAVFKEQLYDRKYLNETLTTQYDFSYQNIKTSNNIHVGEIL